MKKAKTYRAPNYAVINIGCIECGVSSNIVGIFADLDRANYVAEQCRKLYDWREKGQNEYHVFALPVPEEINEEYKGVI